MTPSMIPGGIFLASLMGSLHCAGMCGPIQQSIASSPILYHLGRLISYGGLGVLAGAFGETLLENIESPPFAILSGILFATTLIMLGLQFFRPGFAGHFGRWGTRIQSRTQIYWKKAFQLTNRHGRSFVIGVMTPLLPCAWLISFLTGAALTESPVWGGVFMISFWAGTLPAFGFVNLIKRHLTPVLSLRMRYLAGGMFFLAAFAIVAIRVSSIFHEGSCH